MTTKKCKTRISPTQKRTTKASPTQKRFRRAEILFYISLVIFIFTILGFVLVLLFNRNIGSNYILLFVAYFLVAAIPLVIGFILAIIATVLLKNSSLRASPFRPKSRSSELLHCSRFPWLS